MSKICQNVNQCQTTFVRETSANKRQAAPYGDQDQAPRHQKGLAPRHQKGLAPEHHQRLLDVNILHDWFKHSATTARLTYISDNLIRVPVRIPLSVPHLPSSRFRLSGCLIITLSCCPTASLSHCRIASHCLTAPMPHCRNPPLPHCLTVDSQDSSASPANLMSLRQSE